jgi:hypothetical protein
LLATRRPDDTCFVKYPEHGALAELVAAHQLVGGHAGSVVSDKLIEDLRRETALQLVNARL